MSRYQNIVVRNRLALGNCSQHQGFQSPRNGIHRFSESDVDHWKIFVIDVLQELLVVLSLNPRNLENGGVREQIDWLTRSPKAHHDALFFQRSVHSHGGSRLVVVDKETKFQVATAERFEFLADAALLKVNFVQLAPCDPWQTAKHLVPVERTGALGGSRRHRQVPESQLGLALGRTLVEGSEGGACRGTERTGNHGTGRSTRSDLAVLVLQFGFGRHFEFALPLVILLDNLLDGSRNLVVEILGIDLRGLSRFSGLGNHRLDHVGLDGFHQILSNSWHQFLDVDRCAANDGTASDHVVVEERYHQPDIGRILHIQIKGALVLRPDRLGRLKERLGDVIGKPLARLALGGIGFVDVHVGPGRPRSSHVSRSAQGKNTVVVWLLVQDLQIFLPQSSLYDGAHETCINAVSGCDLLESVVVFWQIVALDRCDLNHSAVQIAGESARDEGNVHPLGTTLPARGIRIGFDVGIKGQSGAKQGRVDIKFGILGCCRKSDGGQPFD
mmetsp:Transcript_23036/g.54386  ORF Transcript_23036/g.54386 Transcript_23036/m.54386 type:complete len:500 (-) Transcript_23036:526-2025(-)